MNQVPPALIHSLASLPDFDRDRFEEAHSKGRPIPSIRVNPAKISRLKAGLDMHSPLALAFRESDGVPWCREGYYLSRRPSFTLDPLFHAGLYYVQEPSSMSIGWIVKQVIDTGKPLKVLDLCGAPGGKSTSLLSILTPESLLVANEVIRSRVPLLTASLSRWGSVNTLVTCNDPADFARLKGYFDLILVDAPCSGSGLFRKDPAAAGAWSPELVDTCSRRQRRILADVLPALKKEGMLIYSTCSYSPGENEAVASWLIREYGMSAVEPAVPPEWHVVTDMGPWDSIRGMRFYPDKLRGEGFFVSCLRKESAAGEIQAGRKRAPSKMGRQGDLVKGWLQEDAGIEIRSVKGMLTGIPVSLVQDMMQLEDLLNVRQSGITLGRAVREEIIPSPALALSTIYRDSLPAVDLDLANAIRYLQKGTFSCSQSMKGWVMACYLGIPLGWAKILPGRINNYYPSSWRILMEGE